MHIRNAASDEWVRAYGASVLPILPCGSFPEAPFGAMWAELQPGERSNANNHHETETLFFVEGTGIAIVDGESREVSPGDVVCVEPFQAHSVQNTGTDKLRYLAVYWEDARAFANATDGAREEGAPSYILVTATPPTVNGELHLGHIAGPYLAGDVYRRYEAMRGRTVFYQSGSDENQSYVVTKGAQKGWSPVETARWFGDRVELALQRLDIRMDVYNRPATSPHHTEFTREFFLRLYRQGALVAKRAPALHCERCDRYLFEAHVAGLCPHCGSGSDGCACEECARLNACVDLTAPRCKHCDGPTTEREVERLYFPLSRYETLIREFHRSVAMSPHVSALCAQALEEGLPDIAVSHVSDWGIPVPVSGFEGQVIYVWMEMCAGYLAATQHVADGGAIERWECVWKNSGARIVQFFGFDNAYFHALLFPALWKAYDPEIRLPSAFVTNEFYLLEGQKFSSSREHAIWAADFAASQPRDAIRFYLGLDRPEHMRTSFSVPQYQETVRSELFGTWVPWLNSLGERVAAEFAGRAPATGTYTPGQRAFLGALLVRVRRVEEALRPETFSLAVVAEELCGLVRSARRFGTGERYLAGVTELSAEHRTAVALELLAAKALAMTAAPLMPDLAAQVWSALGFGDGGPTRWESVPAFVPAGQRVHGLRSVAISAPADAVGTDAVADAIAPSRQFVLEVTT
ncbi:MAG: class I tRNA ligase family protein [Longimicrobiaceae bacterium]